jgi:hypothetical protein
MKTITIELTLNQSIILQDVLKEASDERFECGDYKEDMNEIDKILTIVESKLS